MAEQANFKRINFFEGFFTTDEDWNAGEAYHLEKRRLHNRVLHAPGVVALAGGMRVQARGRGDLSFEVTPGYAIDGRGNELVLRDPAVKVVEADKLKLPQTIYVAIKYYEEPTDFIAYKENPRFKGHRRIEEKVNQGCNDRDLQARYGALVCGAMAAHYAAAPLASPPAPSEPVRIGIVTGYFWRHSVWKAPVKGWLTMLDRNRFQVFGYHTGSNMDAETEIAAECCS